MTKKIDDLMSNLDKKMKAVADNHEKSQEEELLSAKEEIWRLRKTLEEYGIEEEAHINNIEVICQEELNKYAKLVSEGYHLNESDARIIDTLHKNLRMARGNIEKKELRGKQTSEADLLRIVQGKAKK